MMRRIRYILIALVTSLTAAAQLPHSYTCDFEDAAENSLWVLNYTKNSSATFNNKWAIGNAVSSLGMQSMYISPDGGISAGYTFGDSRIMIAWRELDMEAGRYDVAFDWMCGGDSARAALLVAWIPESEFGEMKCMFNDDYKGEGREWLVNNLLKFNGNELLTGGSVWTHAVNTLESDGTPHRLAFFFVYSSTASLVQPGSCVDNIQFSRNNCGEPKNMSVKIASRMAKMEWSSSAEEFNLRMHRMGDNYATQVNGIKQTNFSAQLADGVYDIQIRVICEGDTSVWYNFPTAFVYETTCFDYLDLTDERCSFSMETASDYRQNNDLTYGKIDYGFTSMWSRHTIHYHQEEYDARTFGSIDSRGNSVMPLKTVPEGALASVRVGSWEKTARAARVEYDYIVDAKESSVLMLQYAMVLESSGHNEEGRPRLMIDIVNAETGEALSKCTTVDLAAKTTGEGWNRVPDPAYPDGTRDVCWRDWTTLGLNLADYDGMHVKVKITALGCTAEIHYGYAYFVLTCTSGKLKGIHCGWTPTNEFIAPEGFNYRWYKVTMPSETLGRESIFKVDYQDTCTYAVDLTYKSDPSCGFTLYANAIPRFPIPEATYKLEQHDCHNYITFTNNSHIRTRNWTTGEEVDTQLRPEYVMWGFDNLVPEGLDTQDKLWSPSFQLPDEEADYHFQLYAGVGLCDSIQHFYIHVPTVGPDSIVEVVQRCEGDIYMHHGKPFTRDTLIKDRDYNMAGCDSLHVTDLRFVKAIYTTLEKTIPEGESVSVGPETFSATGEYVVSLVSVAGCDSIVTLRLTVVEPLVVEISSIGSPCPEDASFLIETHARKGKPDTYTLQFDEAGEAVGLTTQTEALTGHPDNTIEVPVPTGVKPGYYPLTLTFASEVNGTYEATGELTIHHSASLIQQRWDDVLGILNAEYNGGYDFRYFRWYRNGEPIEGATEPYYYIESKLQPGDTYSVELKENADERGLTTCGYVVPTAASAPQQAAPRILRDGQLIIRIGDKEYDSLGRQIK